MITFAIYNLITNNIPCVIFGACPSVRESHEHQRETDRLIYLLPESDQRPGSPATALNKNNLWPEFMLLKNLSASSTFSLSMNMDCFSNISRYRNRNRVFSPAVIRLRHCESRPVGMWQSISIEHIVHCPCAVSGGIQAARNDPDPPQENRVLLEYHDILFRF
jgi:hypothetical protein